MRTRDGLVLTLLAALLASACGHAAGTVQTDATHPAPHTAAQVAIPSSATAVTVPGSPRFAGDQDAFCRSLAVDTWTLGMAIAKADVIGQPSTGCAIRYGEPVGGTWSSSTGPAVARSICPV